MWSSILTADGVLVDSNSADVVMTDGDALQNFPQYQNGVRSGRLSPHWMTPNAPQFRYLLRPQGVQPGNLLCLGNWPQLLESIRGRQG